jgi:hypothetical protein
MAVAFPGESAEYRAARNRLLDREIELCRAMEAVAEARRQPGSKGLRSRVRIRHLPPHMARSMVAGRRSGCWLRFFAFGEGILDAAVLEHWLLEHNCYRARCVHQSGR